MATTKEQCPYGSRRRSEEWSSRPHFPFDHHPSNLSSSTTTKSRRFSGSYITSLREDNATSFRSCITISSTASSPGYPFKEEIDPSTYSFTTALKALQARAGNCSKREICMSPDGFALNSKWNEAEKYICNPLSGQVPLECLSAKTLSGRFRNSTRITMSAPLLYSSNSNSNFNYHNNINNNHPIFTSNPLSIPTPDHEIVHFPIQEKRMEVSMMMTRDVGTQSTPPEPKPNPKPESQPETKPEPEESSIIEKSYKKCEVVENGDFPNSNVKFKPHDKVEQKETKGKQEEEKEKKETVEKWKCRRRRRRSSISKSMHGGCLSWLITKRHHHNHKPN